MKNKELICTYCHTSIEDVKDDMVLCNGCGTPYHKDCWDELEVCATYGCNSTTCHNIFDVNYNKHTINNSSIEISLNDSESQTNFLFNDNNFFKSKHKILIPFLVIITLLLVTTCIYVIYNINYNHSVRYIKENYEIEDGMLIKYIGLDNKAYIPYWVTRIAACTFEDSPDLKEINVSKFNKKYASKDGILYRKSFGKLLICPKGKKTFNNISRKVKIITEYAFKDCIYLKKIILPNKLNTIEAHAFLGCSNLEEITIPKTVNTIGEYAFCDCSKLKSITIPNGVKKIKKSCFNGCSSLQKVIIPDSINEICECAFYDCFSLTKITLPNSITKIGNGAFAFCYLKKISLSKSIEYIGAFAFFNCSLQELNIPNSLIEIGESAFGGCDNINVSKDNKYFISYDNVLYTKELSRLILCSTRKKKIVIPNTVKHIDSKAFSDCSNLKSIIIPMHLGDGYGWFGFRRNLSKDCKVIRY